MRIGQLVRGIVKTAVTWAVAWVPLSMIPVGIATLLSGHVPARALIAIAISQAVTGAINGGVFASVLALAGRRKTFDTLSLPWIAACGAVGGALFPIATRAILFATIDMPIPATAMVMTVVTNALLGAGCATVTLAVARRAPALPAEDAQATPALDAGVA